MEGEDILPFIVDDDSDYSADPLQANEEDDLESILKDFRIQWKKELTVKEKKGSTPSPDLQETDKEHQAKILFLHGTKAEQNGRFYEAIGFYRRAMQLVPDIERRIVIMPVTSPRERQESESSVGSCEEDLECDLLQHFGRMQMNEENLTCMPEGNKPGVHISALPVEVLILIFRWVVSNDMDLKSLENLSQVCRGFYLCARDEELWRLICLRVYGVNCGVPRKFGSWRNMFLQRPHLHFNGCYISKCSYMREGEKSFDGFYRPWHLVTYYRYLRFFPDGLMLMQSSPDNPVVTLAKLRLKQTKDPGISKGYYRVIGNRVSAVLKRPKAKDTSSAFTKYKKRKNQQNNLHEYEMTFHVDLEIEDCGKRKHAKLEWLQYSVHTKYTATEQENVTDFELCKKNYPPLVFARVKSYCAFSGAAL